MKRIRLLLWAILAGLTPLLHAQSIEGQVVSEKNEPLAGVNIWIKGTSKGTSTDIRGRFAVKPEKYPVTLVFSFLGYEKVEKTFPAPAKDIKIVMREAAESLDELVITASRTRERLRESPVTVERVPVKQIELATAPSFYDDLIKLRGVQMNTNSLTFQAVNTRGFATFANNRMLQIIDGIDNSSPALNFPLGNLVGISDLDVASVELLPGTSSALYGANAFNGLINIISKNPFEYHGLSFMLKTGVTRQEWAGVHPLYEAAVRYAGTLDKVAFKINFSYLEGTDWMAKDYRDFDIHPRNADRKGSRESNPSYDGLNIYGDEVATDIDLRFYNLGIIRVSRTGYEEVHLTDYKARSIKGDFSVYYRPKGKDTDLELIFLTRFGGGQTIYQGTNRYNLKDLLLKQTKVELRNRHYFIRAYHTSEDAGNSYDMRFAAINVNRLWKDDITWFTQYVRKYGQARMQGIDDYHAHLLARQTADSGRYVPGTRLYREAFEKVVSTAGFQEGAKFVDKTSLNHVEGNYDFRDVIPNGLIQVGGSFRQYSLRSDGTIFTDYDGPIHIRETGAYMQYIQKLFDKRMKLTASLRYDRQDRFRPNWSPRLAMVYFVDKEKQHGVRIAYQTGFRNPTTQDWYIGLDVGRASLVGAHPDNWERWKETLIDNQGQTFVLTGTDAYTNSFTLDSFLEFAETGDPSKLKVAEIIPLGPEKIRSTEIGYRGTLFEKFDLDIVAYQNTYNRFITQQVVMAIPRSYGNVRDSTRYNAIVKSAYKPYGVFTNMDVPVRSYGLDAQAGLRWKKYDFRLIYSYAKLDFDKEKYPDYMTFFNTPEHTFKFIVSGENILPRTGFNVSVTHLDKYLWEATFATDWVPARTTVDAMLYYRIPKYNGLIKVGGTNILGPDYVVAPGTGKVGSIYYLSATVMFK